MKITIVRLIVLMLFTTVSVSTISSCKSKPKDTDIQTAITGKFSAVSELSAVTATVSDGVVTLSGECKDEASKANAENLAKETEGVKSVINNCTVAAPPPAPAPVVISADDQLIKGVADATKDFPGVKTSVKDGVVTLTGEIKKADLKKLMQSLHSLKPKKIENHLTVK
ncbi:MAG: BON domain-containing protein [Bacteroidota bacterium]|jgi:osmotically-inducible protein OsmY|nr:BON domain-containing protein [Bacteroidota bacterium]